MRIIDKVPLPELHLLLGVTNHLFWDKGGLVDLVGREKAMTWPIKCNVVSVGYHGEIFEGPACRKLIKSSDFLQAAEFLKDLENQDSPCKLWSKPASKKFGQALRQLYQIQPGTKFFSYSERSYCFEHLIP